jgi:hypothetical protein
MLPSLDTFASSECCYTDDCTVWAVKWFFHFIYVFFAAIHSLRTSNLLILAGTILRWLPSETRTKRRATQHDCLPSMLDNVGKIEIVYGEEKIFCTGSTIKSSKTQDKILFQHDKPNEQQPRKDPFHLYSLSPFTLSFNRATPNTLLSSL